MATFSKSFNWPILPRCDFVEGDSLCQLINLFVKALSAEQLHPFAITWWFIWFARNK